MKEKKEFVMLTLTALTKYNEYQNILHPWLIRSLVTDV